VDLGACSGDSGGPALDGDGRILGIMSRGRADSCSEVTYTRLDRHASWLRAVVVRASKERGVDPPGWAVQPLGMPTNDDDEEVSVEPASPDASSCTAGGQKAFLAKSEKLGAKAVIALVLGVAL